MVKSNQLCQITAPQSFSRLTRPRVLFKIHRILWHLRDEGASWTFGRMARLSLRRLRRTLHSGTGAAAPARKTVPLRAEEVLSLQPGEWVEVKPEQEILDTLDKNGTNRGLAFLAEMREFCGGRFRVYKRLERMFLEESQQNRAMKNTVLLSGAVCGGRGYGCDRSCLYYWREVWLRRAAPPEAAVTGTAGSVERG